ncbi:MAG: hypothetical protein CMJ40_11130 [Phycisphaerae bacterium]|nr:hypothetical protein [Phycisphaerae bacterium]
MITSALIVAAAATTMVGADSATWQLSIETAGQDVSWTSPTNVRADGELYDMYASVTGVSVLVSYFGFEFGPIDVSDQLPDSSFGGQLEGPCPIDGGTTSIVEPPPPDPITFGFDVTLLLDEEGEGSLLMENIVLGTATTTIPIFGEVTVQLEEVYVDLEITVDVIGTSCATDLNGDNQTNVDDILQLLGAYGTNDSESDVDGDGVVGVNDVLTLIAAWGPC